MSKKTETKWSPTLPLTIVQQFALWALVVAKPLFDILSDHPEYFVANRLTNLEIYGFAVALVVAVPLGDVPPAQRADARPDRIQDSIPERGLDFHWERVALRL